MKCKNCDKEGRCEREIARINGKGRWYHLVPDGNAEYQPAFFLSIQCEEFCDCINPEPKKI